MRLLKKKTPRGEMANNLCESRTIFTILKNGKQNGNIMILNQTGSRLSSIHHQRGLYFYLMNYYAILKEHLQVLHQLHPKHFQITLHKLSAMKFPLV